MCKVWWYVLDCLFIYDVFCCLVINIKISLEISVISIKNEKI